MLVAAFTFAFGILAAPATQASAQATDGVKICEAEETPLFICETNRKEKYLAICGIEEDAGDRWRGVQYRFGPGEHAEFVYPAVPANGGSASKLFFSHMRRGSNYIVDIRFTSGEFTYLIESLADETSDPPGQGRAGVTVTNAAGKTVANIACIERPLMYPEYLRRALACDTESELGAAACGPTPVERASAKGAGSKKPRTPR